ncbi:MAG: undecaprenyl-diphosphate phosphatase [Leptolyngbya sp. PLA3]|nr:MAG: undecaprenyl-diphosphate phosphatase [Cyanobacteria bacterium CYA]MCE7969858.1 undecaprenyl-diphosphate phosphatase [Leptolyngbya sp. PL-A3]
MLASLASVDSTFVTPLHAAVLGLVEGITEYLPISSTGHLIIASALMGLDSPPEQKAAVDAFNIVIQGGAILAVLGLYRQRVWQMILGVLGRDREGLRLAINIIVAFLPAAVLGVLLNDWIDAHLFYAGPVMAALLLGGLFMIGIDYWKVRPEDRLHRPSLPDDFLHLRWHSALFIGLLQCIAMWPGMSRSMMTISGGVLVGLKPKQAAEFSFLLGLPTLGGACVWTLYKDVEGGKPQMFEVIGALPIIVGVVVASVSAGVAVKWLVGFLTRHGLTVFGIYRIVLCAVLGLLWWTGTVSIEPDAVAPTPASEVQP